MARRPENLNSGSCLRPRRRAEDAETGLVAGRGDGGIVRKVVFAILGLTMLILGPCALNTVVPLVLADEEIDAGFVDRCRAAAQRGETWVRDPLALSKEMFGWDNLAEAEGISEVTIEHPSSEHAIIVVIHGAADDSVYEYYDRVELDWAGKGWNPVAHRRAWKGRGHIGWTTSACW